MTWSIEYTEAARRDLRGLDHAVAQQVLRKIDAIKDEPLRAMRRLTGSHDWRLRVGDWRVIVHAQTRQRRIIVKRIQHRSAAYRA